MNKDDLLAAVDRYLGDFGARASIQVSDDISRAIGRRDWDEVYRLQRVKLRIQRLQLTRQRSLYAAVRPHRLGLV